MNNKLFSLIIFGLFQQSAFAGCRPSAPTAVRVITQSDIPYTVRVPGKYLLGSNVTNAAQVAAITVAVPATIDLSGNAIDLANAGGSGIVVNTGVTGVEIYNGIIKNAGNPGPVAATVPNPPVNPAAFTNIPDIRNAYITAIQFQYPFALANPANGVAIFLQDTVSDVVIHDMLFLNDFIGIGGQSSNNNIIISNCQAFECGFDFGASLGEAPFRGGGVIFNNTKDVTFSSNLQIDTCNFATTVGFFGALYVQGVDSTIKNSEAVTPFNTTGADSTKTASFGNEYCTRCVIENCNSRGAQSGFIFIASNYGVCKNCTGSGFSDNCFDVEFSVGYTVENCTAELAILVPQPSPIINKCIGFTSVFSEGSSFLNCIAKNTAVTPTPTFSSGFFLIANDSVISNCQSIDNQVGFAYRGSSNCTMNDNIAVGNVAQGFINTPIFALVPANNIFIRNFASNNGTNYDPSVVNAHVISISANGSTAVAPYVNLQP
jgi:parallel beta-helix repeat protein